MSSYKHSPFNDVIYKNQLTSDIKEYNFFVYVIQG